VEIKAIESRGKRADLVDTIDAVAIVADHWWQAKTAVEAMAKEWGVGAGGAMNSAAILTTMRTGLVGLADETLREDGNRPNARNNFESSRDFAAGARCAAARGARRGCAQVELGPVA
jgi:hypothetical protein